MMKLVSLLALLLCSVRAEETFVIDYFRDPQVTWTGTASAGVGPGNGLYLSPDGSLLVATATDGGVTGMDPDTGDVIFTFAPPPLGFPVNCYGGVTFTPARSTVSRPYFVYSVTDEAPDPLDAPFAKTRVIGVDYSGNQVFSSTQLPGITAGAPVVDSSGNHVLLTHNEDGQIGHVSILFLPLGVPGEALAPAYTDTYTPTDGANFTVVQRPFSPIGYYHQPVAGWYDGGEGNENDIFVFAWATPLDATAVADGDGQLFVIQFGDDYGNDGMGLSYETMGSRTDFHAVTAPVITAQGTSMYMATTKSNHDCYVGEDMLARSYWSRGKTNRISFERAEKPFAKYQSPRAPPVLSDDTLFPTVCGVSAAPQVWCSNYNYEEEATVRETSDLVSSRLLMTVDGVFVLYATQQYLGADGELVMATVPNLGVEWRVPIAGGVTGDIAMSKDSSFVYVASATGEIQALQFAINTSPTAAVTSMPTRSVIPPPLVVTDAPTPVIVNDTLAPTEAATLEATTAGPTIAPTVTVTEATTESPTALDLEGGMAGANDTTSMNVTSPSLPDIPDLSDLTNDTAVTPEVNVTTDSPVAAPVDPPLEPEPVVTDAPVATPVETEQETMSPSFPAEPNSAASFQRCCMAGLLLMLVLL